MNQRRVAGWLTAMACTVLVAAGCSAAEDEGDEEDTVGATESELIDPSTDGCASQCTPGGCVDYARCRTRHDGGRSLPYGLTSYADKRRVAHSAVGHRGCVAVMPSPGHPAFGHVAYVEDTWMAGGARHYRISEASWSYEHRCDTRRGTKAGLHIREFWCP